MPEEISMRVIARIQSEYKSKFGVPRQSGMTSGVKARIVFEDEFRDENLLRGIEQFSHLWLVWVFSENVGKKWTATVRPPRLGGNTRLGVLATRSPFRPSPVGLSCVKLVDVRREKGCGTIIEVEDADLLDGTPIIDIKPYIPYADIKKDASAGFTADALMHKLSVVVPDEIASALPIETLNAITEIIALDPRPSYQDDKAREYAIEFSDFEVFFTVNNNEATIIRVRKI